MRPYNREIDPLAYRFNGDTSRAEIWINIYTALDQRSIEKPDRITKYLLARAGALDFEERRLAILILGELLNTRFGLDILTLSKDTLMNGLKDRDSRVRLASVIAWGSLESMPREHARFIGAKCYHTNPQKNGCNLTSELAEKNYTAQATMAAKPAVVELKKLVIRDPSADVRASSLLALNQLGYLNLIDKNQITELALKRLEDKSSTVRHRALTVLDENETKSVILPMSLLEDSDSSIVMLAAKILSRSDTSKLLQALNKTNKYLPSILAGQVDGLGYTSSDILKSEVVFNRLKYLYANGDLHSKINTSRIFLSHRMFRDGYVAKGHVLALLQQGINSDNPIIQLDALQGLRELNSNYNNIMPALKLASSASHALGSNYEEVRQMAAFVTIEAKPSDKKAFQILAEILRNSSDDNLRSNAREALYITKTTEASQVIAETAWLESTDLIYLRSCSSGGVPLYDLPGSIALESLTNPRCRRALADSATFQNEDADLAVLDKLGLSNDPDIRFNAAYAIGTDLDQSDSSYERRLRPKAKQRLLLIANNQKELIEIRRVAATQLHLHGTPMDEFFKSLKLPLPTTACPNAAYITLGGIAGFHFDPYEGRCMYDSRTGCGDGLPQIYSKLRAKLTKSRK